MIRVLVFDDDASVRTTLTRWCQYQPDLKVVGEAGDGEAAVEIARSVAADVYAGPTVLRAT